MTPSIVLREAIAADDTTFAKGMIMGWPSTMELPPGMIWLREEVMVVGPDGAPLVAWGDIIPQARKIMQEIAER
jgi:hypothetical protein